MTILQCKTLKEIERSFILQTLREHQDNRTHTARALGIGLRTLQRKLNSYGIPKGTHRNSPTRQRIKNNDY